MAGMKSGVDPVFAPNEGTFGFHHPKHALDHPVFDHHRPDRQHALS